MKKLQILYTTFEQYIASYTTDITTIKDSLYHQKQGTNVLTTNLYKFFTEKEYTSTTFKHYDKLFVEDKNYLQSLFPQETSFHQKTIFPQYKTLVSLERNHTIIKTILDISTFFMWRIIVR